MNTDHADIYNLSFPHSFFENEVREGFFVPGMMKRLWAGNLKVLSAIASICKRHKIPWFVICGTLLGAVRHGGFVPWDDDLDIIMKRDDLQRFLEVAPAEIPESYRLLNVQTDYHVEHSVVRIINWEELTGGIVTEFYGCPYTCGVDIFALDGRYPDEESEKKRRERFYDVLVAIKHVTLHTTHLDICQELIKKIEKENHCHIVQDDLLYGRLCAVINKIYREVPLKEGTEGEMFHGINDHLVFHSDCFREMIWMPFEHIRLPVPAGYNEVLTSNYGDYMYTRRGGSAHDYPVFARQEAEMKQIFGHNPFRYTFEPSHLSAPHGVSPRGEADEIRAILKAAQEKIDLCLQAGDAHSAAQLMEASRALQEKLDAITGACNVLFLAARAAWWETLAPYHAAESQKTGTQVTVACIPWYEKEISLKRGAKHEESDLFPQEIGVISSESTDLLSQMWNTIYIQFPFDMTDQAVEIDDRYTSAALRMVTDRLIYVPCFEPAVPEPEDEQGHITMHYLVEQPAVAYADAVCLPSENMRRLYIDLMTEIAGESTADIWEKKFVADGGEMV